MYTLLFENVSNNEHNIIRINMVAYPFK